MYWLLVSLVKVNHANQFMDAVMVVCSCRRPVSYLMAEASWKRRIVGDIAWAMGVVPVKRAQDDAVVGTGTIQLSPPETIPKTETEEEQASIVVEGIGTIFCRELAVGDKIRPPGTAFGLKIKAIESDTRMIVDGMDLPNDFPSSFFEKDAKPVAFDLLKHTPLTTVFEKVLDRLAGGGAVGIFPEGGSHDRTDLLPLKIGISLIAYSALEKDGLNVPIVPVGLSYFRAHRWRGRAVVEYGRPFYIKSSTLDDFKAGGSRRRAVCSALLEEVETNMRSVIFSAPDYEALELIHTARRLYQRKRFGSLETVERQNLTRRFVEGYKRLLLMADGNPPREWLDLQDRISAYRNELKDLGIKDYQVPALTEEHLDETLDIENVSGDKLIRFFQIGYNIAQKLTLGIVSAIPVLLLNLPVAVMAGFYSERRRKKALAHSKVKIKGFDVMLTEKVLFCLVMVPTLWIIYGLILLFGTNWDRPTIFVVMLSMPVFAYTGISVTEAGIIEWYSDIRPFVMRLFPSARRRLAALPATRTALQQDLRQFIRTIGPEMGEIYFGTNVDWTKIQEQSKIDSVKKMK
jgi:glycerol-3-phosphate O-acyltransferase / dihydroxyacetone phosphate acyltransferase